MPAWTRRRSEAGKFVRRARSEERVEMVVDSGTWRANVLPATFRMKTCIVGSASADDERVEVLEREEIEEMLLERIMEVVVIYEGPWV